MKHEVVVVDVDGVLCDLVEAAIPVINKLFECCLSRDDIRMFEIDRIVGVHKSEFDEIFSQLDYENMEVVKGAQDGLQRLAERFKIVIATSRPPALHETTKKWLQENELYFDGFMSLERNGAVQGKKSDFYPLADAVVDDDLREVIAASYHTRSSCLVDAPWNHSINAQNRFRRCFGWGEVVQNCMDLPARGSPGQS